MADEKAPAGQPAPGAPADGGDDLETPGTVTPKQKEQYGSAFKRARAEHDARVEGGNAPKPAAKPGAAPAGSLGKSRDGTRKEAKGPAAPKAAAAAPAVADPETEEGGDIEDDDFVADPLELDPQEEGAGDEGGGEGDEGDGDEPDPSLVVTIPARRDGEEELNFVAETQADADRLRELVNGNMRRDESYAIRDEAEAIRDEAEELQYAIQADPAGFLLREMGNVEDLSDLAKFVLTRGKGSILETLKPWLQGILDTPEAFDAEKDRADARRVNRRDKVAREIKRERHITQNARAVTKSVRVAMDELVPADFKFRDKLYNIVLSDIQADSEKRNALFDPKNAAKMVTDSLAMFGVTAKAPADPNAPKGARPPAGPPAPRKPTGASLKKASDVRRKAAAPGPGVGSPTVGAIKIAPSKNREEGKTAIKRAFATVRRAWNAAKRQPS